jgi:DNA invertase Pin-like site-specific DNA recombinase
MKRKLAPGSGTQPEVAANRAAGRGTSGGAPNPRPPRSGQPRPVAGTRSLYLGIARVSTEEQAEHGHSLDAQDARLTEEADRRGVDLELIPVPGRSGKAMSPELRAALDRLARGEAAGLMVTKLDRLTRRVSIASDIIAAAQAQGWNLVVADLGIDLSTWQGRAMAHMLATFAEVERELISERTRDGLAVARSQGKRIGRPRLVSDAIRERIITEREKGNSFRLIAQDLTADGVLSPEGRPAWQASTVRRIYNAAQDAPVRTAA